MTDINELEKEELEELSKVNVEAEEVGLEDLIVLGESKKIPIHITYPNTDGTKSKAKALVKQLTLKEIDGLNYSDNTFALSKKILKRALFKQNGEKFTSAELNELPVGVVRAVSDKILELSGIEPKTQDNLKDF